MTVLRVALCGALGLALGPLLNLVIDRVPERRPLWGDGNPGGIHWRPASARELLVDLGAAVLFAAVAARFARDWALPAYLVFVAAALVVSVIDLEHYLIPNRVIYPTLAVSLPLLAGAAALEHDWGRLLQALIAATVAWAMLLAVHLISPQGMGFGDVRLAFVLGLFLGWVGYRYAVLGLFLGFFFGALIGVALMVVGRRSRKDAIPFGPFLALGGVVALLAGSPLLAWYLGG